MMHAAMRYSTAPEIAGRLVPILNAALDDDHAVLVCLDDEKSTALVKGIGARSDRITFTPLATRYTRPAQAIDALATFIDASVRAGAPAVHSIGELPLDGTDGDEDWIRYEAAANDIFASVPLHAICLYRHDVPVDVHDAIGRTHPHVDSCNGWELSATYAGAAAGCAQLTVPRLAPERSPDFTLRGVGDPRTARVGVSDAMSPTVRTAVADTMALVVSELVTNAILHGGGAANVSLWMEPASLVVTVHDDGPGIDDPFAGLRPPDLPRRGAGLWVTHHLCDRVAIERPTAGGSSITARIDLRAH
jgi:anti-sigma regulatory factor (Ser/Thr protein kinase)